MNFARFGSATALIDGYKLGHKGQYPKNTEQVYTNSTSRKSRIPGVEHTVFFGLQYFIAEYLIECFNKSFFKKSKEDALAYAKRRFNNYLNKDVDISHLSDLHDLGFLPLTIKALPEGTLVPIKVPAWTIRISDEYKGPKFSWLVNYLETIASCSTWGPSNSATIAFQFKRLLTKYAKLTGAPLEFVPWQGHDFSFRGMFGLEAAVLSGMGHLTSFTGTDTIPAIDALEEYYGANVDQELIGGSVDATEHSVMCAGGDDNEMYTFERLLTEVYPTGILSVVSDTWDYFGVLTKILPQLKDIILKRDGKLVIRPDSGDSVKIITGWKSAVISSEESYMSELIEAVLMGAEAVRFKGKYYALVKDETLTNTYKFGRELSEAEVKGTIQLLWELFGGEVNEKGFKMLNPKIGAILGDGVTLTNCEEMLERLKLQGFASNCMVFGIGSFTYQYNTRDTLGMAMKATYVEIAGEGKAIFKDPKTDSGMKKSAKGLLQVKRVEGAHGSALVLKDEATPEEEEDSELQVVFKNGQFVRFFTIKEIRENLDRQLAYLG